jgi:DNA (cytosine-5)-methyltransferase 1
MANPPGILEVCAGAGGCALGLERAGFAHVALVETDSVACQTLRRNRPWWNVIEADLRTINGAEFPNVDLLAGGLPSPPFSVAGDRLGLEDDRDVFPATLRIIKESRPRAVLLDNVKGFLSERFAPYRRNVVSCLEHLGYRSEIKLLNASSFGVSQSRPIAVLIALQATQAQAFGWPAPLASQPDTVGELLYSMMAARGWAGASLWRNNAAGIAPAIVGGSRKHGGPDLGPSRTKKAWADLGVNGLSLGNDPPEADFGGPPRLTVPMVARIQGFPEEWVFEGGKTAVYKQIAQALPPPVSEALGVAILRWLSASS